MLKRITSATITAIALCRRGKNGLKTLLKDDGSVEFGTLVKAAGDNELLCVVYAPERPDDDGDFAEADVIKSMAHSYLRDHRALDIEHDGKKLSDKQAYVAESFIVAKGDMRFQDWKNYDGNSAGDLTGAWASVIKIEDPVLQKAYREGGWDGVSLFGRAAVERVENKAAARRVADRLAKALHPQENEMNEEQLKAALAAFKVEVGTLVKSAIEAVLKPEPKPQPKDELKMPVFKGSTSDPKALEAYENELRAYQIQKAAADGTLTVDQIVELRKALAEVEPKDAEAGIEKDDSPKERELKRELFKARKARNAPERHGQNQESDEIELAKANHAEGLKIAELFNQASGASSMRVVSK